MRNTASLVVALALALVLPAASLFAQAAPPPEQGALDQRYATDVREKVEQPHQAAMQRLNESYRVTLENSLKKAAGEGKLDDAVVWQKESKQFTETGKVPESDEPGTPAELARVRAAWRAEAARLAKVRAASLQPIQQAYIASLRLQERELTRLLKLDEAIAVRTKIDALTAELAKAAPAPAAPIAAATPAASPAPARTALNAPQPLPGGLTILPYARPAERADFYASGNNSSSVFRNGKEVLTGVDRNNFKKARVSGLKEGDVITILQNGRFSDNFIWLSAISPEGAFLFETGLDWKCYLPKNPAKWWDIKNIDKEDSPTSQTVQNEYEPLVKRAAMATPLFHGTPPIHSVLQVGNAHQPMYFYHVLTRQDLLPKQVPADTVLSGPPIPATPKKK
jgi:hypothetical protein